MTELTNSQLSKRRWYERNKEYVKLKARETQKNIADEVYRLKMNPCTDCGVIYLPCVMDFDHVRGEKIGDVSSLIKNGSRQKVMEEIQKCELVCANCHRIRTWYRRGKPYEFDVLVYNGFDS